MSDELWEDVKALAEQVADTRRQAERAEAAIERVRALMAAPGYTEAGAPVILLDDLEWALR